MQESALRAVAAVTTYIKKESTHLHLVNVKNSLEGIKEQLNKKEKKLLPGM